MVETSQNGKEKGRGLWTTLVVLVCVLLIPLLVVNLTIIIKSIADPQQVPGFLGYKPLIVLSGSMEPTILPGDIVIVKEVPAEDLQKGDIVSYLRENSVITHRIMEISQTDGNRNFYTKGDNNNADDGVPVTDDMLEGKYLFRIPRLGHAAIFMQTPTGMLLFIAVPLILFILYDVFRRRHYDKREEKATKQLEAELEAMKKKLAEAEASGKPGSDEGRVGEQVSD